MSDGETITGNRSPDVEHFLDLIRKSRRGKFKIYIGMSAGVGKTYRMLQEAQSLMRNGVDVKVGYIETHGRKETVNQLEGLPVLPRRKLFYKGKELDELDVQAVINLHPEVVIVIDMVQTQQRQTQRVRPDAGQVNAQIGEMEFAG